MGEGVPKNLVDGAVCLRRHLRGLPLTAVGLDFYHLSEHVNQGRRATFGEDAKAGKQGVDRVLHTVRHKGYRPFWHACPGGAPGNEAVNAVTPTICCTTWRSGAKWSPMTNSSGTAGTWEPARSRPLDKGGGKLRA